MPLGRPDEVQWHSAADLKEAQNPELFVGWAGGQAWGMAKEASETKKSIMAKIFFIIMSPFVLIIGSFLTIVIFFENKVDNLAISVCNHKDAGT